VVILKGEVLEDFNFDSNHNYYKKGQLVAVTELEGFETLYAVYRYDGVDWLPKEIVKIK
jgi:hypothetical protein